MMRAQLEKPQQQHPERGAAASSREPLRNRAGESDSPFVRAYAETPVAWQPLDAATLARAWTENRPIFMHIGFLADHLCRLTAQDSFSNPSVAAFLNDAFIPVIIDREERPDLDTIYQNYSEAVNATGGWPLNLFLTPDLFPIFGGTYWPGPGTEHSATGAAVVGADSAGEDSYRDFLAIAKKIHKYWVEQEERCRREAFDMLHKLQGFAQEGTYNSTDGGATAAAPSPALSPDASDLDLDQLDEALATIAKLFDPVHYGFGTPKFPNPARLSFLLRLTAFPSEVRDVIGEKDVAHATSMAVGTLRRIRDGGLRDHLGAGFMRFSVTSDWSLPHFEKMVADNALLLGVFLDAWLGSSTPAGGGKGPSLDGEFADVVLEVADYLTSPLIRQPDGGFVSSEAADSFYRRGDRHVREGAFYLWTRREFDQVVGGGAAAVDHASSVAAAYWNVQEDGNVPQDEDPFDEFINENVLSVNKDVGELSRQFGVPAEEIRRLVAAAREKLRTHREKERVRPARDEKVIVGVNGMVIAALARTAAAIRSLDPERAARYLQAARDAATFIKQKLWLERDGKGSLALRRFFWQRPSQTLAFADDYAFLIDGLLDLYTATFEREWLTWAKQLQDTQTELFYDPPQAKGSSPQETPTPTPRRAYSGGFYSTESIALSPTILRLKSGMDKSQPATNAVSVSNLFRLGALLGIDSYDLQARETLSAFEPEVLQYPYLFVGLLNSVVTARLGVRRFYVRRRGDGDALRAFYTSPRAEARVLILVDEEEGGQAATGQHPAGRETGREVGDGAGSLQSRVERLEIGSRS